MKRALTGLVLVVVFAICAVAAAAASAAEFTGPVGKAISGTGGTQTFTIFDPEAHKVTCKKDSVSGKVESSPSKTAAESVTFESCSGFGGTVKVETGSFVFKAPEGSIPGSGTVEVAKALLVENKTAKCKVTVTTAGNSALSKIEFGSLMVGVEATPNVSGISYTVAEGGTTACGTAGSYSNGTYVGEVTTVNTTEGEALMVL